ncbi:tryptophan synthase subunit alpha, partial [Omnitrophica bacterium]|nr:tryptophan synthase subunit alpha [Candidatus Omnitrophota bacterium]
MKNEKMKKNRLVRKIKDSLSKKKKIFCAFITVGYPNLRVTEQLILELERAGTDIIELGFPFSDPMADGPTIQFSSEQALKKGVKLRDAFALVKNVRRKGCQIPVVFFSYLNPVFHYGKERFARAAAESGFDGLIIPDLPPEEESDLRKLCAKQGMAQIFLLAPTSGLERSRQIARASRGFVYYVSLRGVTGVRNALPADLKKDLRKVRRRISNPVLIGFGVSNTRQGADLSKLCDGVIVGSGIIDRIRRSGGKIEPAVKFVRSMV